MFLPIPLWLLGFPPGLVFMRFFSLMSGSSLLDLFRLPILALFCSSLAYYSSIARTIQACKCKEKVTKGTVLQAMERDILLPSSPSCCPAKVYPFPLVGEFPNPPAEY